MSVKSEISKLKRESREVDVLAGMKAMFPNLWGVMWGQGPVKGLRLSIRNRDDGTTFATCAGVKRETNSPVVAFGSGLGFIGALTGLQGAIARGDWKPDKFAEVRPVVEQLS